MNIYFQTKNCEAHPDFKEYMAQKMAHLRKFFPWDANASIDIEQKSATNNAPDLFNVSINIDAPEQRFFTEESQATMRKSFDDAYKEIIRIVHTHRSKTQSLTRRAGARIKNFFKRQK